MAAKKAKGIEKKLPWSCLDRRETRVASDEDGEHEKEVCISRQRALLKAGASITSREAVGATRSAAAVSCRKLTRAPRETSPAVVATRRSPRTGTTT